MDKIELKRISAARSAIAVAGGPSELARKLSRYLAAEVDRRRIEQWRYRGIPEGWSVIVEHVTGVSRQELNPQLYNVQVAHRVIHSKLTSATAAESTT